MTCVIFIKWSSTTLAKWYVGKPSLFMMMKSSSRSAFLYAPYTRSCAVAGFSEALNLIVCGSPFAARLSDSELSMPAHVPG